jgi:uncharacterized membrane protein YhhN
MWITLLTVLVFISAAFTLYAEYYGPPKIVYLCKPFATCCLVLLALVPKNPVPQAYRYLIVAGMLCSLAGDVFLMLPSDKFMQGLISFLVAHLFYIAAFALSAERTALHVLAGLWLFLYGGLMLWWLWPTLGKMRVPVIIYMLVILLMGWTALSRYVWTQQSGSGLAALGALIFIASDSILAVNRFKGGFRLAQLLILSTYFAAQWLIALST